MGIVNWVGVSFVSRFGVCVAARFSRCVIKVRPICHQWIRQLFKLLLNICIHSMSYSRQLILCGFTDVCMNRDTHSFIHCLLSVSVVIIWSAYKTAIHMFSFQEAISWRFLDPDLTGLQPSPSIIIPVFHTTTPVGLQL